MTESHDYLLCYGKAGDFGRFQSPEALACPRGQRLVVQSQRGEELGVVMRPAAPGHAPLLPGRYVGRILRIAGKTDLQLAERLAARSHDLFLRARELASARALAIEILDAEILLDGRQGVLYCLKPPAFETEPFIGMLAEASGLELFLRDLALHAEDEQSEEPALAGGCGAPNCGAGSGGCGSCGSSACSSCVLHQAVSRSAGRLRETSPL